ncbi:MAG TPA: hypothetical protein VHU18_00585 [Rhizomicrobium sp.]|nr:hypothetical protein [Rhizomicrobium sp.]
MQERSRKPCRATIVDQMEKGARVLVKDAGELPDELYLIDLDSGMAHQANVAWRSSDEVGLEFARSIMLDATTPNDLLHLRDIWIRAA